MRPQDFELLLSASRTLASTLELDKLLNIVLKLAAQVVEAETGSLLLWDEKTNELVFDIALGEAGTDLKTIRLKMGEGIAGWVAQENRPQIVNDPPSDPRWAKRADQKTKFITRSILCVPMCYQGKLLGVVQAVNKKSEQGFSEDDLAILEAFAAQTAVAIQNARLFSSLRQEKEKVETIFSQMTDGAVLTDDSGMIVISNPAADRLIGAAELPGEKKTVRQVLAAFSVNPPFDSIRDSDGGIVPFEASRSEGKTLVLSGVSKKIQTDKGELIGHLIVFRDITAAKKEEKLKRDFLSLMSHKLKTPLVAITGYTPMLLEDEDLPKLNPFFVKAIKAIHGQGMHLKQLVEKLIAFSVIEAEEMSLLQKPQKIKPLITDVVGGMTTYLEDKKARVEIDPSLEGFPSIHVDQEKFREVMKSLIENAVKFNRKEVKKVVVRARATPDMAAISVEDDGVGIPPEECEKIFQKFYQIEESFTGQVEGAGLGLALVKKLTEAHGGTVTVESRIGEGSTFTVFLPLAADGECENKK